MVDSTTQIYWDNFANEVVTEIEDIAPPERYIRLYCGNISDVFIEKWYIDSNKYVDVAYSTFARNNGYVWMTRKEVEEFNKIRLSYIVNWTVPEEHYKKLMASLEDRND